MPKSTKRVGKKSKVVDIKRATTKEKTPIQEATAAAKPAGNDRSISLTDFLLGEFRGHSVAVRMLSRAIAEAQNDLKAMLLEIDSATKVAEGEEPKHSPEDLAALKQQSEQARNLIGQWHTQIRERAGMMWQAQKMLATVDQRYANGPQLPGLPSIREMPDLTKLDPPTVEEVLEQQRIAEEARLEQVKADQEAKKASTKKAKKKKKAVEEEPEEEEEELEDEEVVEEEETVEEEEDDDDEGEDEDEDEDEDD